MANASSPSNWAASTNVYDTSGNVIGHRGASSGTFYPVASGAGGAGTYNGVPGWAGPANNPQVNVQTRPNTYTPGTEYKLPSGESVMLQTSGGAGGTLTAAPAFGYAGAYGGVPQVPSPQATQATALGGNLANLPLATQLASATNQFNNAQAVAPYQANLPNYQNILGQASQNALSLSQGQLPTDVVRQIQQAAAERGVSTGTVGSPNTNASYLQALGLNSLQAKQTGLNQFGQLMGLTPVGQQLNPASMFVTPEQQQAAQAAANLYGAAPIPAEKAAADLAALRAGMYQGQGQVNTPQAPTAAAAPTRTPLITPPTFISTPAPTAPGRLFDPNAYAPPGRVEGEPAPQPSYPGADASLSEIYDFLGISDFPGAPDYSASIPGFESVPAEPGYEQMPGFESLYEDFATP